MKKKLFAGIVILLVLVLGVIVYMVNSQKTSTGLDVKEEKILKHGFRLLEEQLAIYIKEHYSGVSRIEFSPIFIEGGREDPPFTADILPVVYDKEGNRAVFGTQIKNMLYASYGVTGDLYLDFDGDDKEVILLVTLTQGIRTKNDVSNYKELPNQAKLKESSKIDKNLVALVDDGQLKNVEKNEKGSPDAQISYNLEIRRGDYMKWE